MKDYLILDIETTQAPDADNFKPVFAEPKLTKEGKPYANQKTIEEQERDWNDGCALHPKTGQVAVVGINEDGNITQWHLPDKPDPESKPAEAWIVQTAHSTIKRCLTKGYSIIGFNIKHFDLPFLALRGLKYGIRPAWNYADRYNTQILDIAEYMMQGNYYDPKWKYTSFNDVCMYFGLEPKLADGADFGKLWVADKEKALSYNKDELVKLEKIARIIWE